jgi:hypothetical protein
MGEKSRQADKVHGASERSSGERVRARSDSRAVAARLHHKVVPTPVEEL